MQASLSESQENLSARSRMELGKLLDCMNISLGNVSSKQYSLSLVFLYLTLMNN